MRYIRKHYDYIIVVSILFLVGILPNIQFINKYYTFLTENDRNSTMYSIEMWGYMFYLSRGAVLLQLFAPLLITIVCIRNFYAKITSGFILNEIQWRGYKPTIIREVILVYLKSLIPLFGYSCILFISTFFILTKSGFDNSVSFMGIDNPLSHFLTVHFNMIFFSFAIANISLLITLYVKRFALVVLLTQGLFVAINILLYIISFGVSSFVRIKNLDSYTYLYNLYALDGKVSYVWMMIIGIMFYSGTLTFLAHKLRNKERFVDLIE